MITYVRELDKSYMKVPVYTSLSLVRAGVTRVAHGWRFKKRFLDSFELLFATSGTIFVELRGEPYELSEGRLLICPPYCSIVGARPSEGPVTFYWADYRVEAKEGASYTPKLRKVANTAQMEQWMLGMCEICWQNQSNMVVGDAILLQLLDSVSRDDGLNTEQITLLRSIRMFIDENLHTCPSVNSVARAMGYAPDHLTRLFKAKYGMLLGEYIWRRKMYAAKNMLTSSSYTIREVGELLGFEDANRFTKFFTYHEGTSAQSYRNARQ